MSRCVMLNCLTVLQRSAFACLWFWSSNNILGAGGRTAFVHQCGLKDCDSSEQKG